MRGQKYGSYCRSRLENRMRGLILLVLMGTLLAFSGCTDANVNSQNRIVPPLQDKSPLEGSWKVISLVPAQQPSGQNQAAVEPEKYELVQFTRDAMATGQRSWKDIRYQAKVVDSGAYYMFKRDEGMEGFRKLKKEIQVITVTSNDQYVCEFAMLSKQKLAGELEGYVMVLEKVSDAVDNPLFSGIAADRTGGVSTNPELKKTVRSGLLLGLRKAGSQEGNQPDSYRTLWIAAENRNLQNVRWIEGILLPRHSGFWKVDVKRMIKGDRQEDAISAFRISDNKEMQLQVFFATGTPGGTEPRRISRSITFIGNDYVAMELAWSNNETPEPAVYSCLQVKPVDNLANLQGVTLSDLAGPDAGEALKTGRNNTIIRLAGQDILPWDTGFQEENFGLVRRFGHWFFKGRISGANKEGEPYNADYDINLIPPEKLVFFDTLCVSWTAVKDRVPEAVDAFTSPNRDIAVIVTGSRLLVYGIENGALAQKPYQKYKLEEGESVMMAEWARGNYVQSWTRTFNSYPVNEVKRVSETAGTGSP